MNVILGTNVPEAYCEAFWKMRVWAIEEQSRNGPVMSAAMPVMLEILHPIERVLFDPVRNANPFFHVMETVWMFAGSNDVRFLEFYNARYREYADPGSDTVHGAYGYRWRDHFGVDQIERVVGVLEQDPASRRAVISMWDPSSDLEKHADVPCNTSIMFRIVGKKLHMTVINRSNDLVWGMLGANAVHMTYLHELVALALGKDVGIYRVFTNNLHVYKNLENFNEVWQTVSAYDPYRAGKVKPLPLLEKGENWRDLLDDCERFVYLKQRGNFKTAWMMNVVLPIHCAYADRKERKGDGMKFVNLIVASDWRMACSEWVQRKIRSSSTSTGPSPATSTGTT
jgi:hypothetical protein